MGNWKLVKWSIRFALLFVLIQCGISGYSQGKAEWVPDEAILQHAGSIGYFSLGAGYEIFKNKRGSLDIFYGYVPEGKGGQLHILTAKTAYRPFKIKVNRAVQIRPLNPGVFLSYTLDRNLSLFWDRDQYVKRYYGWSEALRTHLSLSNEVELDGRRLFGSHSIKGLVVYSEFNASDLYLISWAVNSKGLSLAEIFKLGIGVQVKF